MNDPLRNDELRVNELRVNELRANELPSDRQAVQVKFDKSDWQPATFRRGQFIDLYGLPLDPQKISSWRPANENRNGSE